MIKFAEAYHPTTIIIFSIIVLVGGLFLSNLTLAVLKYTFSENNKNNLNEN